MRRAGSCAPSPGGAERDPEPATRRDAASEDMIAVCMPKATQIAPKTIEARKRRGGARGEVRAVPRRSSAASPGSRSPSARRRWLRSRAPKQQHEQDGAARRVRRRSTRRPRAGARTRPGTPGRDRSGPPGARTAPPAACRRLRCPRRAAGTTGLEIPGAAGEVDEAVAQRGRARARADHDDHAEARVRSTGPPRAARCAAWLARPRPRLRGGAGVVDEEASCRQPDHAIAEADQEDESNPPGARQQEEGQSGPIIAPAVSRARCTPKDVARPARSVLSEIIASRGAVRIPLPVRSIRARPRPRNHAADTPERACRPPRGVARSRRPPCGADAVGEKTAQQPDDAAAPWYRPSNTPNCSGREAERVDEVERQDGGHHLRGDVGEEARRGRASAPCARPPSGAGPSAPAALRWPPPALRWPRPGRCALTCTRR